MKIGAKQYALALMDLVGDTKHTQIKDIVPKFAKVLLDNNSMHLLDRIIEEFEKIWNKKNNLVLACVETAKEIDLKNTELIKEQIMKAVGSDKVIIDSKVNKNILGGAIITYGDKIIDASLANRLRSLKSHLNS